MIEARDSSVPLRKASTPRSAKGETAEVGSRGSDRFPLGRQRTSAGLSQKFFVKRYQWLFGTRLQRHAAFP